MSALATPCRRHGRRTLMCSSQPRWTPSAWFSFGEYRREHDPGDLVTGPGDPPQARVEVRRAERPGEVGVGPLAVAPVVSEGIRLGVEDPPVVRRIDRPDLEPRREIERRDGLVEAPCHLGEVAHRLVAVAAKKGLGAVLTTEDPGMEVPRDVAGVAGRDNSEAVLLGVEQRLADAPPSERGIDLAVRVVGVAVVADGPACPAIGDDAAIELGHDQVPLGVLVLPVGELVCELVDRRKKSTPSSRWAASITATIPGRSSAPR